MVRVQGEAETEGLAADKALVGGLSLSSPVFAYVSKTGHARKAARLRGGLGPTLRAPSSQSIIERLVESLFDLGQFIVREFGKPAAFGSRELAAVLME